MRVLAACSLGGAGHLNPLVPLLEAATRACHQTLVVAPPAMEEMVRGAGFAYQAGGEPAEAEIAPIRERLPLAPVEEASVLGNRELFGRLATTAMLPRMERACVEWAPDLVLRDPCEYASAVVAHRRGIGTAQVAISLAEAEYGSIAAAAPALEAHRSGLTDELTASPYLTRFPESLDPSPFPVTVRYHEQRAAAQPLPDWWGGRDGPLIYVTFGTVLGHMTIATQVYRAAIAAVARFDARVLLTFGRKFEASALGDLPDNVHVEPWVDQVHVLDEADVVVCHGGSGTTLGALAAGVPLVVVPVFADQFENGRRVGGAGAGVIIEGAAVAAVGTRRVVGTDDVPQIAEAVARALEEPSYRRGAERLAAELASTPTVDEMLISLL